MADRQAANPYFDRTLDTFRAAVKAWGRDSLIVVFLFMAAGIFTVLPLVRWYEKETGIRLKMEDNQSRRSQIEEILQEVQNIQKLFAVTKKAADQYGYQLADGLSENLSRFGNAVRDLKRDEPRRPDMSERFPGSSIAEQFERPAVSRVEKDPGTVLMKDFNLSEKEIALITSSERGSPQWEQAAQIVKKVFDTEIDRTYENLNERTAKEYAKLMESIRKTLDSVRPAAENLGLQLPTPDQVVRPMVPIHRPPDEAIFKSRAGKFRALEIEALKIAVDLDAALRPLNSAHERIVAVAEKLDQSINALKIEQTAAREEIQRLEEQFTEVEAQLTKISQPLKWLPLEVDRFVRLYPTIFAVLFFILAMRFGRLSRLRNRLYQELKDRAMTEKEISFALMVPESTLDPFGDIGPGSWAARGVRLIVPVALAAFLIGSAWRIESSPLYTTTLPRLCNITAVSLCILSGFYILRATAFFTFSPALQESGASRN